MKTLYLVSCVSKKAHCATAASEMYQSEWFKKASTYAETRGWWLILSAKHGLLNPSTIIDPYEETLNTKPAESRRMWSVKVMSDLLPLLENTGIREIVFLAGAKYREHLLPWLGAEGYTTTVPMARLGIGKQLKWLKEHTQ